MIDMLKTGGAGDTKCLYCKHFGVKKCDFSNDLFPWCYKHFFIVNENHNYCDDFAERK